MWHWHLNLSCFFSLCFNSLKPISLSPSSFFWDWALSFCYQIQVVFILRWLCQYQSSSVFMCSSYWLWRLSHPHHLWCHCLASTSSSLWSLSPSGMVNFLLYHLNVPLTMNMKLWNYARSAKSKHSLCITCKCILIQWGYIIALLAVQLGSLLCVVMASVVRFPSLAAQLLNVLCRLTTVLGGPEAPVPY
jgi:hypothetical protein